MKTKTLSKEEPMTWSSVRRGSGLLEWACSCGVGHPDQRSAAKMAEKRGDPVWTWTIHGCCGHCRRKDFPGKLKKDACNNKLQ